LQTIYIGVDRAAIGQHLTSPAPWLTSGATRVPREPGHRFGRKRAVIARHDPVSAMAPTKVSLTVGDGGDVAECAARGGSACLDANAGL
jgi:hypothetical protein